MIAGPLGTALLPKAVFGLFEWFSTFSSVVSYAVLGVDGTAAKQRYCGKHRLIVL